MRPEMTYVNTETMGRRVGIDVTVVNGGVAADAGMRRRHATDLFREPPRAGGADPRFAR
jgi:hypothetical protein